MKIDFNSILNGALGALVALILFEMVVSKALGLDSFEDDGY